LTIDLHRYFIAMYCCIGLFGVHSLHCATWAILNRELADIKKGRLDNP